MKRILFILLLLSVSFGSCAQRNYTAKKLLFSHVQKPYINYGYIYNGYAALDSRNIAPYGWSVFNVNTHYYPLINAYGGVNNAGGAIKSVGFTYWNSPNTGATNISKLNGKGCGIRSSSGSFSSLKNSCGWWCIGAELGNSSYSFQFTNGSISTNLFFIQRVNGNSIILVKDSSSLSDGESGTMTGNDGKIYRTIKVAGYEFLADPLAETLYRNGDSIPEVTDNAAWAALTTGARCVYNNDETYR